MLEKAICALQELSHFHLDLESPPNGETVSLQESSTQSKGREIRAAVSDTTY
jgi:hypothetical protein